jgi:MoxR-like ATPase
MPNSCVDCPAKIAGQEAASFWGVDASEVRDFIYCSRYGHVLGDGAGVRVEVADRYGASCASFGQGKPLVAPASPVMGRWMPDSNLLDPTAINERPSSCLSCSKFDDAHDACAAKGTVVFISKAMETANDCNFGYAGAKAHTVSGDLPGWSGPSNAFVMTGTTPPTSAPKPPTVNFKIVEPVDYDSDAQVSTEHAARGIRAWREVMSPFGRQHFLPIFRTDFFTEEDQSLIPSSSSDYGDPSLFIDHDNVEVEFAVQCYTKDMNLVLVGEPGTGKTEGCRYLAWRMNVPFRRLTYNEASEPDQFLGMYQYGPHPEVQPDGTIQEVKGTYFAPGELPITWTKLGLALSDEPNLAPEAIVQSYRSMNDSSRELVVFNHKFRRHDYCFHVMAMNPHYDFRNIGAKPLASADSRRLSFHLMHPPTPDQIKAVLTRAVKKLDNEDIEPQVLKIIVEVNDDLREMSKNGQLPDFWTVSQDVKVARLVPDFGLEGAYRRAYFNYIDPDTADLALGIVRTKIPHGFAWA